LNNYKHQWIVSIRDCARQRSNKIYTVLYRDTLVLGLWSRLTDVQASTTTHIVEVIDQPPVTPTRRFYRLATPHMPNVNSGTGLNNVPRRISLF